MAAARLVGVVLRLSAQPHNIGYRTASAAVLLLCAPAIALRDKVFFLGPGSTSSRTLHRFMKSPGMGYSSTHYRCLKDSERKGREFTESKPLWAHDARDHISDSVCWSRFNAFSDAGEQADFEWLDVHFADARFVLNTRPLLPLLVSRLDHHRRDANSSTHSLAWHELPLPPDTTEWIVQLVVALAAHQERVLRYFGASWERMQRFVVVSVQTMDPCEVGELLRWVTRPDWRGTRTTRELVDDPAKLPAPAPPLNSSDRLCLPTRHFGDEGAHPASSLHAVLSVVKDELGCDDRALHQLMYRGCAQHGRLYAARFINGTIVV